MIRSSIALCFTGHRKLEMNSFQDIQVRLRAEIISAVVNGYPDFVSGCAIGVDTVVFFVVEEVRRMLEFCNLGIRNILAIPFEGHSSRFSNNDKSVFKLMLHQCDEFL